MPELPEVETIKNQLNRLVSGKKIKSARAILPKIVKTGPAGLKKIAGLQIKEISRRAKIFIFKLTGGLALIIHLKMTGQLIFAKDPHDLATKQNKYTHLIFHFTDGSALLFNDLRQFGYVKIINQKDIAREIKESDLGPEPLEKSFTFGQFQQILATRPRKKIKQFLMDPYLIAGIGNIYSDEILFLSRVHPERQVEALKTSEQKAIFNNIKKVLREAIAVRGTSASDYVDAQGKEGGYDKKLRVYGKKKGKCPKCHSPIAFKKINGRTAHFCPRCQK